MDRYEFIEGGSRKFWEAGVEGATLTVRFGRVGTGGQAKDKIFADAAAADKELKKLVREKTGKGYALVGGAAPAPLAAMVAAPSKLSPEPTTRAPDPGAPERTASEPAGAVPESIPSRTATDEGRGRLFDAAPLPTRMRPGAPVPPARAWAELRRLVEETATPTDDDERAAAGRLAALLTPEPPRTMAIRDAREVVNALIGAHVYEGMRWEKLRKNPSRMALTEKLRLFAHWLVGTQGALAAVQAANVLRPPDYGGRNDDYDWGWGENHSLGLRDAITSALDADYDAALALAIAICEREPDNIQLKAFYAFILADDRPARHALQPLAVLEDAERRGVEVAVRHRLHPLIAEAAPSAAAGWRLKRADLFYLTYAEVEAGRLAATMIEAARRHGEPAIAPLTWLLAQATHEHQTAVAEAMLEMREDDAVAELLPVLHEKWVRAALDRAAAVYPAWTFGRCLSLLAAGRLEPSLQSRVLDAVARHGAEAARAWAAALGPRVAGHLDRLLGARSAAAAPREDWPAVLRDPPWRVGAKAAELDIAFALTPIPTPFAYGPAKAWTGPHHTYRTNQARVLSSMAELPDAIAAAEAKPRDSWRQVPSPNSPPPRPGNSEAEVLDWLSRRLTEIDRATRYGLRYGTYEDVYGGLERQPDALALALWELTGPLLNGNVDWEDTAPAMLDRFGERAVPGLAGIASSDPILGFKLFAEVDAAPLAPVAARALLKLKTARDGAILWLRRHRATALLRLVSDAVGRAGEARDAAEHALRWFVADRPDGSAALEEAIAAYAGTEPRVRDAVAQVLGRDPLLRVPSKVARLPGWLTPASLSPPALSATGDVLPPDAVAAVCEMLSFSTPDAVYGGVGRLKEGCTPESLGAFAWDLFSAWLAAGAPSKDGWAMRALGWLGDDAVARRLTPLIRRWPGEAAHARAVTGLDVLCDIGSDVALVNLNGIAEKLKFKGLQERAREKIAALAEARELTPDELADRLAPDLDLDARGGLDLDFGQRRFRAGFDELLRPVVKDEVGKRLKDLPKPVKSDDAERAAAAVARWSALKKDARAIAGLQLARLESMLATGRRVKPDAFGAFFAAHPLLRNLAGRLVWGAYADAAPGSAPQLTFRVTEEGDFSDAADEPVALDLSTAAAGLVGLVHPLQVGPGVLERWGALFGDYEIAQPFPQLGRDTHALTEAEKAGPTLKRFAGVEVDTARLRGMPARGWAIGTLSDHGVATCLERSVILADGSAAIAVLGIDGGLWAGAPDVEPKEQELGNVTLQLRDRPGAHATFGTLDPLTASELLRGPAALLASVAA